MVTWLQISHQIEFNNCVLGMKMLKLQAIPRLKRQTQDKKELKQGCKSIYC